jgi:cytochrome c oxidase subunit 3
MYKDINRLKKYENYMRSLGQRHFFHMVTPSPWPFFTATNVFFIALSAVMYMHGYSNGGVYLFIGLFNTIFIVSLWLRDVVREGTFEGMHTRIVQKNLKMGFALFIVSEIMFFFGFFWAFFHCSLAPAVEIGCIWPPVGIVPIYPYKLPLLNTIILLISGAYITVCHAALRAADAFSLYVFFGLTLGAAISFLCIQVYEYYTAAFAISDGIYGSVFYMLTGFHGFHVFMGAVFIFVCYLRALKGHFTTTHHVGFECAAWYWHFVDVVWLFLFIFVYCWGTWGYVF